ncbi:D-isomer specific 2-hydroxyacid dehydrogenase family protein [Oceaniovalibus guishaninsula JLT2003]|uniref:D-isomer specific 2-hydroxyacid dehydrogenase family protein n=1 Tax=Oceaniovalibus guishaninsula JLT2003 TaxID=1231392 RepID=K2HSQ8_9RHOB|nr:2-hydroxyacid dehydrogenase [Oceaniovalibus guishaninsula]EKE45644.1 D-isomer specific 2-hydroxyacid dehydrogenase family protein [Oceaniovalibus guishaninsula JLT2003]
MTETIIAIGGYDPWDRDALERMGRVIWLTVADGIADLPADDRDAVRIVAFKGHTPFPAQAIARLPKLELIANFGVGYDAIDADAARARGIAITNTPDVLNDDVADLAVALLLAQSRQIVQGHRHVTSGAWAADGPMALNRKVSGKRAGIMGLGRIGHAIAHRLTGFDMDIHYHSRSEKKTPGWTFHPDPVDLAAAVDFLFVSLVGGPGTDGYVSAQVIDALGPDGILVNISRGSTVDEDALIAALRDNRIRGAALDVFRSEPDPDPRFLDLPNVLLQPHQASATVETRSAMGRVQRENIAAFLKGRPLVTPV